MRYLVTGGAGFIGSHIAEGLLALGHEVRIVDNLVTGRIENLTPFLNRLEFIRGDIADPAVAQKAVAGVDGIFHQAAVPSVPRSLKDPFVTQRSGEIATLTLLEAAVKAEVPRLVFAGSSSVYGNTPTLPKVETMPLCPRSPYAASKMACEGYLAAYATCYPIDTIVLRYFNVFGPRQDPTSQYSGVIARFTTGMPRGERPTIFGNGEQTRDFCFIENAVRANLLAMNATGRWFGEVVNIGCGRRISLNFLVEAINRIQGTDLTPIYTPDRPGDVRDSLADISKAKTLLGYEPVVDVEAGLARLLEYTARFAD